MSAALIIAWIVIIICVIIAIAILTMTITALYRKTANAEMLLMFTKTFIACIIVTVTVLHFWII